MFSCEYYEILKNIYFKGYLWTTVSELYWFKVEEIIEKTETHLETIIGDVFRTHWNISDARFCKNSWLYLTVDYFCKKLHIIRFTGLLIRLDKTKNRTAISTNLFLFILIITLQWDINHKFKTRVCRFKLIHPCRWIHLILVSHFLPV